jgi:hypothetical protein
MPSIAAVYNNAVVLTAQNPHLIYRYFYGRYMQSVYLFF